MFESLFKNPLTRRRHQTAPLLEERLRYLSALQQRGYSKRVLQQIAQKLLVVIRELGPDAIRKVDATQLDAASERFMKGRRRLPSRPEPKHPGNYFKPFARNWLHFLGWLREPIPVPEPFAPYLEDFCTWMRDERNLSPQTILTKRYHVGGLLRWHHAQGGKTEDLGLSDVAAFLAERGTGRWARRTIAAMADSLRAFFRFGALRGWWCPSIAEAIEGPVVYRDETLPAGPAWADIGRLIESLDPHDPTDVRDRAMILLLAVYGLRAGEVASMTLDEIKWEARELLVRRSKSAAKHKYPLVAWVAEALWVYLRVRPNCACSELFVTMKAPFKPISRHIVYNEVAHRLTALGVPLRHCGPHSLRHACAARLVSEGLSLKEIGDQLGHRSAAATRIYAKVDLPHLRKVAAFDLGGLS